MDFTNLVVVDDGSADHASVVVSEDKDVKVLRHMVNLGPGASTMTGIKYALSMGAQFIATIDADNQNDPVDLVRMLLELEEREVDLLIGSRFLQENEIPISRVVYNYAGNIISYFKTGLMLSDSQSGLKIMTRNFAEDLNIDYNGFEFCIDIIKKARLKNWKVTEMPISVTYTKDTMSKGQSFQNGLMMLGRLLNPF